MPSHHETIVEQFTKQAIPFSTAPGIKDEQALKLLVDFTGAGSDDTVLDVACGPGLVVCAFAQVTRHATGIDLTPAMIDRARLLQREKNLLNVTWRVDDVLPLPYPNASFSIVVSRFAFHHLPNPRAVLAEMKRVCVPGGKVVLVDIAASSDPEKAAAFNAMEKLRDPSHVRAMPLTEMEELFRNVALRTPRMTFYRLESELDGLLQRSFPNPGDSDRIRQMFLDAIVNDGFGVGTRRHRGQIRFAYPIAIVLAENSAG